MEALQFYVRYAAGCGGAGAGGRKRGGGMQPYAVKEVGVDLFFVHLPIQIDLFLHSWVLNSHYAGRRVTGCRRCLAGRHQEQETLKSSVNAYLPSADLQGRTKSR
ncbi:hypothetical protein FQA47_007455 [Oryzias melastigma]|uniref:Uncharacterized protein n=1 Tax=Oryzias melastigma TaxID=30732 RepID=A0A834BLM7_ORYME|nr:hypothetical protein FQA47_007455 [Oryzias melastigma]